MNEKCIHGCNAMIATCGCFPRRTPTMRETFEEIISASPYEKEIDRFPDDATRHAWPGNYRDINVQLAWDVLCDVVLSGSKLVKDEE